MRLPVGAREEGSVWRIYLAANRMRLFGEPANGVDRFRVSAVSVGNRHASHEKYAEREFFISWKHEHGSSELPDWQHIQRESRHSGGFARRREDASDKLFAGRAGHEHRDEKETARRFLPRSQYRGVSSRFRSEEHTSEL